MIRVTIWNEFWHERHKDRVKENFPEGMHVHLQKALAAEDFTIRTAYLGQDEYDGLSPEVLDNTDVLMWWGHCKHNDVKDEVVARVVARVHAGMGFIGMHSAHASKPFTRLMGTPCSLLWRDEGECAHVWTVAPNHPIAEGVPLDFRLDQEEMYGEYFQIPVPDDLIFVTWFQGGHVFRGGCTFTRGMGKIFYFHPGHEYYRSFYNPHVLRVLQNGIRWTKPSEVKDLRSGAQVPPVEPLR